MEDFVSVSIPTDDEGFVLLRCPKCGEYFKIISQDVDSNEVIEIQCPLCGLVSDSYWTDDVVELAQVKALNMALESFYGEMKKLERKTRNSFIKVKADKLEQNEELPIKSSVDSMEIVDLKCCNKTIKIRQLLKFCGCYCPYCGGYTDGSNES